MEITIQPHRLRGEIAIIPSKSLAHRMLICAAFAQNTTTLLCPDTNHDIEATAECLRVLGADIVRTSAGYRIEPISRVPDSAVLNCGESGSTLRFLLPIVGALGIESHFLMEGRLSQRPLSPLWEEMVRMGCTLTRPESHTIRCQGKLRPGHYQIDGGVSSQFISGLLLAFPLMESKCTLEITGKIESKPYIEMTKAVMQQFHADPDSPVMHRYHSPGYIPIEGDWSNGSFFLAANALGSEITVTNLNPNSPQGDRAILRLLPELRENRIISAADCPDLVPILAVVAAANQGAVFTDIQRLRLKESDRVASVIEMIRNLGGDADATENTLTVYGTGLVGGRVSSHNDHRIAMAAAIASTVCSNPVTISGAEAVAKSYPRFWEEFQRLGGNP